MASFSYRTPYRGYYVRDAFIPYYDSNIEKDETDDAGEFDSFKSNLCNIVSTNLT